MPDNLVADNIPYREAANDLTSGGIGGTNKLWLN